MRHAAIASIAAIALGFGAVGCGDDEEPAASGDVATEETDSASAEEVSVVASEYAFDLSATPTADTTSLVVSNEGEEFHVLIFAKINEGFTVEEAIELEGKEGSADGVAEVELPPGASETVEIKAPLEPGPYAMLCPIGGPEGAHYELGQLEEFEIQ